MHRSWTPDDPRDVGGHKLRQACPRWKARDSDLPPVENLLYVPVHGPIGSSIMHGPYRRY